MRPAPEISALPLPLSYSPGGNTIITSDLPRHSLVMQVGNGGLDERNVGEKNCSWFSELPDFIEAWRLIAGLGKLAFDEVWCPPKFPPTIYWLLPVNYSPVDLNTTCGCNWRNILNQVQGTKCKCESVLSSWISINHNHALNIIIEKTINSCVRVWNAEFSITHLYKFPDD